MPLLPYCVIGLPMDRDIKGLEKIGLQEVCKKTHIEVKQLEYMINNQFDKLNKINTLGFVKILSREYKLDLTDWLEGFYDYWADHKAEEENKKNKIFIRANSDKSYKKLAWLFLLVMLISGIFAVFSIFKIDIDLANLLDKTKFETQVAGYQSAPVVQEAAKSLGVKVEERIVETNSSNSTVETVIVRTDENSTSKMETNNGQMSLSLVEEKNTTIAVLPKNRAMIIPKRKIWVGIIALDTFNRQVVSDDKNITIDLTKKQLVKTGNGYFSLSYDGTVEDFTEQGSTRFLVENGTIKKISEESFIALNKGKNW